MPDELAKIVDADERVKVEQNPSEAELLQPPKPLFIDVGAFSGANESTRSFETRPVPRTPEGLRQLVKSLGVRLAIETVNGLHDAESFEVDVTLEGLSSEWIGDLCRKVPALTELVEQLRELEAFKRDMTRRPQERRQLNHWYKGMLPG